MRAASRRWRKRHPEKQAAATLSWRRRNLNKWNKYQREWRRRNPLLARAATRRRYLRIKLSPARYAKHLAAGRKWSKAHPDQQRLRRKRYRKLHLDQMRAYQRQWMRRWYKKNTEEARKMQAARRSKNVDQWRDRDRRYYRKTRIEKPERYERKLITNRSWAKRNRLKLSHWAGQYRARRKGAAGTHSFKEWMKRVQIFRWRCFYCSKKLSGKSLTKDHRVPLFAGGSDAVTNLVPACKSCNSAKRDRLNWKATRGARRTAPRKAAQVKISQ